MSSSHKNIYQEQFANFDLEKKEKDNFLRANNDKIKINICVADFCSYCFNINFIKKAAHPSVLPFLLFSHKKHHSPPNFHFPLILLSVKLNLNFYQESFVVNIIFVINCGFYFCESICSFVILNSSGNYFGFYFNSRQKVLYYNIYFLSIILYFRSKKLPFSPYFTRGFDFQSRIYVPPKPDIRAAQTGYKCH